MEIKDKQLFRIEMRNKIDKFVKDFPVHFYGNAIINSVLVFGIFCVLAVYFMSIRYSQGFIFAPVSQELLVYGIFIIISISAVLRVTIKSFLRNLDILRDMHSGKYAFGIGDHEMDNAIEFIEELPMKKDEVDRLRTSLSFDKLINVLEATRIISCENNEYVMDIVFRYKMINILNDESHLKKTASN